MTKTAMRRAFVVLLVAVVGGAMVPALTSAASGKAHQSAKKKHKKKGKVKVKCAATKTCPGVGPTGPQGPSGSAGPQGPTTGSSVRQRIRTTGAQTTASCDDTAPNNSCPDQNLATLSNNTWSQPANEFEFMGGTFNVTTPSQSATGSGCTQGGTNPSPGPGWARIQVLLDGTDIGDTTVGANGSNGTQTVNRNLPFAQSEIPSGTSSANHTLTIKISDNCASGSNAGQGGHFTINSAAADVVAFG